MDFTTTIFWVQVYGLPLDRQFKENLLRIGNFMGRAIDVDLSGDGPGLWKKYVKVRVEIDISCPLCPGFPLDRGRLGHEMRACLGKESQVQLKEDIPIGRFGCWLRAESKEFQPGIDLESLNKLDSTECFRSKLPMVVPSETRLAS